MDVENLKSWASQPDVCRCCLSASGTLDITASYITESGIKEVFCDMLQECYGITLSHLTTWGPSRMVCSLCVGHLRDACSFRSQVLLADKHFDEHWNKSDVIKEVQIKCELDLEGTPAYYEGDDEGVAQNDEDDSEQPLHIMKKIKPLLTNIKPAKRRKGQKTGIKVRRKRREILDKDYDSDVPIALLVDRVTSFDGGTKDMEDGGRDEIELCNRTTRRAKSTVQNHNENKKIRSNITLLLKNTNIIPFQHINNSKYSCLYCENSYLLFKELKTHVIVAHSEIKEEEIIKCLKTPKNLIKADICDLKCKLCDIGFKKIENIIEHLTIIHKKSYFNTSVKPSHGILPFDFTSENFKCCICSKEFRFFKNLSMHMNEHSNNFMCHYCGKNFVSDHRLQTHIIMHRKTDVACKICGKEYKNISAMKYHIRKIHNELKYKCSECDKQFAQPYHRLRHLVDCHRLKKPEFKCSICGKEFASSGGLSAHIRYSHLKTTQYSCDICGKTFVYKWIWQRHLELHSGTKNYECKFCNKKFAKPYTLQMHVRIHLNDKRFSCSVCKAAFIQKCSLKNHIRVHHPDAQCDSK